jgi:transposase
VADRTLTPDFKTIANFRNDNGKAISNVCRQFVALCQQLGLFSDALVAVDGSKFKAVNNRDRNFTNAKLQRRMEEIASSINCYLIALDTADRQEPERKQITRARLHENIAALKAQMRDLEDIKLKLGQTPDQQVSQTDPDARSMKTRGTGVVGYNVQTAVDAKHHLIVAHEVTNIGSDRDQLWAMSQQAQEAIGVRSLTVVADRGYFKGEEILACSQAGIDVIVPKNVTSNATAEGRFGKADFIYDADTNEYHCPAGEHLIWRFTRERNEFPSLLEFALPAVQTQNPVHAKPTAASDTREHEAVLDAMQERLERTPDAMRIRRQTVEHPFGTIKAWMGATHFLTKTKARVSTEMSLHVLAYNMKRMINIFGVGKLMQVMSA